MAKKPSEMNVVDRIFHDIALHGLDSVIKNKEFYQKYKPIEFSQHDVISSNLFRCRDEDKGRSRCPDRCKECQAFY